MTQLIRYEAERSALQAASSGTGNSRFPSLPGVYAMFNGDECIYVGESKNLRNRLSNHERRQQNPGCNIRFHVCDEHKEFEKLLIKDLRPKKNGISPSQEYMQARAKEKYAMIPMECREDRMNHAFSTIFGGSLSQFFGF
jgi:excinuclease UvrABC nuclease subunit